MKGYKRFKKKRYNGNDEYSPIKGEKYPPFGIDEPTDDTIPQVSTDEEPVRKNDTPVNLTQTITYTLSRVGYNPASDKALYELVYILGCVKVKDVKIYNDVYQLPEKMTFGEAREKMEEDRRGLLFPKIQQIVDENREKVDKFIEDDYKTKLENTVITILRDLEKQGILEWGDMDSFGSQTMMPMQDENFQIIRNTNPVYRKFLSGGV